MQNNKKRKNRKKKTISNDMASNAKEKIRSETESWLLLFGIRIIWVERTIKFDMVASGFFNFFAKPHKA